MGRTVPRRLRESIIREVDARRPQASRSACQAATSGRAECAPAPTTAGRVRSSFGATKEVPMQFENPIQALRWGTIVLLAAIAADLGEFLVDPAGTSDAAKLYDAAVLHHGRMVAAAAFLLLSSLFVVPAAVWLLRSIQDRGRRLGQVAAVLALMGAIGHGALAAIYLVWAAMPGGEGSRPAMIAATERFNEASASAILFPFIIAFPFALVAVFLAQVRAAAVPRWVLIPVLAAPATAIAGLSTVIALVLLLAATAVLAVRAFRPVSADAGVAPAAA
jgi:hypothetical protein